MPLRLAPQLRKPGRRASVQKDSLTRSDKSLAQCMTTLSPTSIRSWHKLLRWHPDNNSGKLRERDQAVCCENCTCPVSKPTPTSPTFSQGEVLVYIVSWKKNWDFGLEVVAPFHGPGGPETPVVPCALRDRAGKMGEVNQHPAV